MPLLLVGVALVPRDIKLNNGWEFRSEGAPAWSKVTLPHAARLEDDQAPAFHSFQGVVEYRRQVPAHPGRREVLKFEAAMQVAEVWVNGRMRLRHTGGYLPFSVDLSQDAEAGKPIDVRVQLDNRDHPEFPPGRPQGQLDFTYAGGLYRNVWLEVTDKSHIDDVYAFSENVTQDGADVEVHTTATSQSTNVEILDPSGKSVATVLGAIARFHLRKPMLWDLDHPNLYRAVVRLFSGRKIVDTITSRFGIRHLEFDHQRGCRLNGKPLRLEGTNRHMGFPVVGNAASDDAQYREARRLKSFGMNILRLAHYPQSPAFLDACDELGILVIDPIPGWQFYRDTPEFRSHVLQDVAETVRRDRNHPCVAIFETCLNETYSPGDDFWIQCSRTAHDEFGRGNFFTGGDAVGKRNTSRPIWDVPWTGWDEGNFSRPQLFAGQKGIDREYGDYEFGGEESSSRVDRAGGEGALMLQAWNFIWSHNRNRGNSWSFGDLTWEGIDTYRGMNPTSPISKSGLFDLFRLPKPVAYFYQSQGVSAPVVHIANLWTDRPSPTKVVVFGNCDTVKLLLNGREIARSRPDHGPTNGYLGPKVADPLYWARGKGEITPATENAKSIGGAVGALPFSGGNCEFLSHPPFTFEGIPFAAGKLEAVGMRGDSVVARDAIYTPGPAVGLKIEVDTQGRPLRPDGSDFVFVYVSVVDGHGQPVPASTDRIRLKVSGAAHILGADTRPAVAGIAPFMIQSNGRAGKVEIEATSGTLVGRQAIILR